MASSDSQSDWNTPMRRRLRRTEEALTSVSGALLRVALLSFGILIFGVLVTESTRNTVVILPIELGSTAESAGLTQIAVTRWLADEMLKVGEAAKSRAREQTQVSFERLPQDFTIAATGLSVGAIVENVRYYLGTWKTVSGELSYTDKQLTLAVRVSGKPSAFFQRSAEPRDLATVARSLVADGAVAALEQISPFHGAAFHFARGPAFYDDAERNIFTAIRTGSREEQAAAMSLWGLMALRLRQYDVADERLARASLLDPSLDLAVTNRGAVAEERGDLTTAIEHYRRAVEIDPRSALASGNFGRALCRQKRCDQGLRYLRAAVALEPWNPRVAINVGVGLAAGGRVTEAEKAHTEAAFTHPGEPEVFQALGRFHQARIDDLTRRAPELKEAESAELDRHLAQAERAYGRAVQLAPMNAEFHLDLGNFFYLRVIQNHATDVGRTLAQAHEAYSKAISLNDRSALAYRNRGVIDLMRNALQSALRDLTRALELDPASRESYCAIAEAYAATNNQDLEGAARAKCRPPTGSR